MSYDYPAFRCLGSDGELYNLCCDALSSNESRNRIRLWLKRHEKDIELLKKAANYERGPGETPLYRLVAAHPDSDLVMRLLELAPETIQKTTRSDALPLHNACWHKASSVVIDLLVEEYQEALMVKDMNGWMPLHCACEKEASPEEVQMLLDKYDGAALEKTDQGDLPIHLACKKKHSLTGEQSLKIVKMLLEKHPETAGEKNGSNHLPLYVACKSRADWNITMLLFESWPASWLDDDIEEIVKILMEDFLQGPGELNKCMLLSSDKNGNTLLHHACENGSPPNVIQMLLDKCPDAAELKNTAGDLPLHKACECTIPYPDIVSMLLAVNPKASETKNEEGDLPLHKACEKGSLEVIEMLLKAYVGGVGVQNNKGELPLHVECSHIDKHLQKKISFHVMKMLVQAFPDSLKTTDIHGHIPLDRANLSKSEEICSLLTPQAV
jgi:ankyrin repeat protein